MASKWKLGTYEGYFVVTNGAFKFALREKHHNAEDLCFLLNERETLLEENAAFREQCRWRKIGEEWPKDGQWCQVANRFEVRDGTTQWQGNRWADVGADESIQPCGELFFNGCNTEVYYTHWRPVPMDVPKEASDVE